MYLLNLQEIDQEIDTIILQLKSPVSSDEAADGWDLKSKQNFALFFEELKIKLDSHEQIPDLSVARAMDMWGISGWPLIELAAELSNKLRQI